ncbi:MAG: SUMF1/EgtB/PvdO family nonheme iron enzyme [Sandaracinaceae bacterium]|nr:SUMF1/EgtB/PvdO family nonheme iron enzyme [Sandaracinaceae bacterium]
MRGPTARGWRLASLAARGGRAPLLAAEARVRRVITIALVLLAGCEDSGYCVENCPRDGEVVMDAGAEDAGFDGGRADLDATACVPADGATELCNDEDDDCDGRVDEDFDFTSDLLNCGSCDTQCRFSNADAVCMDGACVVTGCLDGFVDLDDTPGCEYACPIFPTQAEDCNGFDDDCDGEIDEPAELPPPPSDLCRTTPGTPCAGVGVICTAREGRTTWFCDYPPEVEFDPVIPNGIVLDEVRCDGFDGDCDGVRDEAFPTLGDSCDNGDRGACRDVGVIACDPTDDTATVCDLTALPDPAPSAPSAEVCNGVDDDCDGVIDNSDPTDPARVMDDMVHITRGGLDFWIYRHEASRPDASGTLGGTSGARACGRGAVMPWTSVGYAEATAACAAAGHRLCTPAEWLAACQGGDGRAYPYGASYAPMTCNGADRDAIPGGAIDSRVEPTGALAMCLSPDGVADLSGNVKEWTDDERGSVVVVRGGSHESPALGLTCATELSRATADTILPTLGFRCCDDDGP